ncbi:hypothetical protein PtA15_1A688 [Puccinia triticina]|uniref:Uncharacterized protein n=1 Tax=Puccinia triticina TaxID=208348 RepID=A0ABY7C8W4_9BASI|nr:uncharacterized protein PtA15_1A688 [Puccinia triticina]WAQ81348.1 hypothetical protein PtA15_1A688 [Puccinia triticina]
MAIYRLNVLGANRRQATQHRLHSNQIPPIQNVMDNNTFTYASCHDDEEHGEQHTEDGLGGDHDENLPGWVGLSEEEPDEIDLLIAADKEKHRQQARDFNWDVLLNNLVAEYLRLRILTKNWASTNSYDNFSQCPSSCVKKYN